MSQWMKGEDSFFWILRPDCNCNGGKHNPFPVICKGFGNEHLCRVTKKALQGVLRCPDCHPKQLTEEQ